jgi:DNA-binding LacI/PurR family transcriptional regulator
VLTDFEAGGRLAAESLVAHGRERFLLLTAEAYGEQKAPAAWERGVRSVLRAAGLPAPTVRRASDVTGDDYRAIFSGDHAPDAVLSINDFRAVEMLQAIAPLGLSVGRDFEVIGQYDTPWAEAWGLTSLSIGVDRILSHLDGLLDSRRDIDVLVAPTLVHRQSAPA